MPFSSWFEKLDGNVRSQVMVRIKRIEKGNFGDCKFIREGIREMRIHKGAGYRLYFFQRDANTVVILRGGNKSTQDRDISKAKKTLGNLQIKPT